MSEGPERLRSGGGTFAVLALALLLIGYPLSLGPAIVIHQKLSSPPVQRVLEVIYAPLELAHDHTPLRKPLDWYVEFWE